MKIITGNWKCRGYSEYWWRNIVLTDFETSFLDHKHGYENDKKTPVSDISKDISILIYIVIYIL